MLESNREQGTAIPSIKKYNIRKVKLALVKNYCQTLGLPFEEYTKPERFELLCKIIGSKKPTVSFYGMAHAYLAMVKEVTVFDHGNILTEDDYLFVHGLHYSNYSDSIERFLEGNELEKEGSTITLKIEQSSFTIEEECVFVIGSPNFGHWLFETLTRFALLEKNPRLYQLKFLISTEVPKRYLEFLYLLGIKQDQIVELPPLASVQVKNLWIPSAVCYRGHYDDVVYYLWPEAISYLRNKLLNEPLGSCQTLLKKPTRLFIRREYTQWRSIPNQEQATTMLANYGFQSIVMEDYSIRQQLDIISNAEIIVIVGGGGSPMTMFSARNACVIEVVPPDIGGMWGTRIWAELLNQYWCRICGYHRGETSEHANRFTQKNMFQPMYLPIDEIQKVVEQAIAIKSRNLDFNQELLNQLFPDLKIIHHKTDKKH